MSRTPAASSTARTALPAITPDVTVLHAQAADREGNVLLRGIVGASREAAMAARTLVVTVERVVDSLDAPMNSFVIPGWQVAAIVAAAMLMNLLAAATVGVVVPLALRRLRIDPALSAGVILTTFTDCIGFATLLSLGALFLT